MLYIYRFPDWLVCIHNGQDKPYSDIFGKAEVRFLFLRCKMSGTNSKMSVWELMLLTAVNMIGAGIILLPASLAEVGGISVLSWGITTFCSTCLAYAFAKCGMYSTRPGGMSGYAEYIFGTAGNFLCCYVYTVSILVSNVAIALSAVGYGATCLDISLGAVPTCLYTIAVIWLTTVPNFSGAGITGRIGGITIFGVLIPVFIIATAGWFFFSPSLYIANWNVQHLPFSQGIQQSVVMTLWAFLGLESACVNADAVENPERNVPIAVLGGTLGSAIIYILSTNVIFGMLPAAYVAQSNAPFGLVFAYMFGPVAGKVVMALMCIACLGSLLGWQFTGGNIYRAAAAKGFYPSLLARVNRFGAPVTGMVIAGIIQTGLSLMTISPSLNEQFEALTNLAVITNVIPYFFCMAAMEFIMIKAGHGRREELRLPMIASFMGSLYTLYACYAAGADAMMAAALVFFFGLTLYGFLAPSFEK